VLNFEIFGHPCEMGAKEGSQHKECSDWNMVVTAVDAPMTINTSTPTDGIETNPTQEFVVARIWKIHILIPNCGITCNEFKAAAATPAVSLSIEDEHLILFFQSCTLESHDCVRHHAAEVYTQTTITTQDAPEGLGCIWPFHCHCSCSERKLGGHSADRACLEQDVGWSPAKGAAISKCEA
jgi:hypothetical protein